VNADVKIDNRRAAPGTNALLQGKLAGQFSFALTADAKPTSFQGETKLTVTKAEGEFAELSSLSATLNSDASPTKIKQAALTFEKGGTKLGDVRISGPFDPAKKEAQLQVAASLGREVLNLVGALTGMDLGASGGSV